MRYDRGSTFRHFFMTKPFEAKSPKFRSCFSSKTLVLIPRPWEGFFHRVVALSVFSTVVLRGGIELLKPRTLEGKNGAPLS